ncbi:MAG: large subunit ribosomal protein L18, partial [Candidatus Berkelbacteria bacterium Licking1014_96]
MRIRKKIIGSQECPRLCIFKSNRFIYAQVIDDEEKKTYVAASDLK